MTEVNILVQAKPFLKWVGGKTQLLPELTKRLPRQIKESGVIKRYVEPFVGGGAFFFHLKSRFMIEDAYLMDINQELMLGYQVVQREPDALIQQLSRLEQHYLELDQERRKEYYYTIRDRYNRQKCRIDFQTFTTDWIIRASYLIFLNKTCYNGLYRQNQRGEFNAPHGRYDYPTICDSENIKAASQALTGVNLICGDFYRSRPFIDQNTLVYFDPPYRPLTRTSCFTNYSSIDFTDDDQIRLAEYFRELDGIGAALLLSNSDPKVSDPDDEFFDKLYQGFIIDRVYAKRSINCDGSGRGEITELVIRNS